MNNVWSDSSSHESKFATANGINLHYLDWGGTGTPLLFLAGSGDSAHIFDEIAPHFTDQFCVLAMTRRGHGQSDRPETGYDLSTLAEDICLFLEALHISRVSLVGHSMAGDELTMFANRYPEKVGKLVYLDASLRHLWLTDPIDDPIVCPPPTAADFASLDSLRAWLKGQFGFWSQAQEANLRATMVTLPDGSVRVGLPYQIGEAFTQGVLDFQAKPLPDHISALGLFSVMYQHPNLLPDADQDSRRVAQAYIDSWRAQQIAEIEFFKQMIPHGQVVELANAHHYLFVDQRARVVEEMQAFLRL